MEEIKSGATGLLNCPHSQISQKITASCAVFRQRFSVDHLRVVHAEKKKTKKEEEEEGTLVCSTAYYRGFCNVLAVTLVSTFRTNFTNFWMVTTLERWGLQSLSVRTVEASHFPRGLRPISQHNWSVADMLLTPIHDLQKFLPAYCFM